MMRNTFAARLFLLSMLGSGFDVTVAVANAAEAPPPVALVSAGPGLLEWTPLVEAEGMTLVLADSQGVVRTHYFAPGEAPALSLFDAQGAPLPDDTYTWELRVTPRLGADLQRKIEDARRRGNEGQLARLSRVSAPLVQSGYFTLADGRLVAPDLVESPVSGSRQGSPAALDIVTAPDQMVTDDLIVDGKGCIGLGCTNNESFGAEALRLKQSVVRLRFEDTSTQAGIPARDWQLTVNDSASGGAGRFSVEDLTAGATPFTVAGGAPSNSLYVSPSGSVGVGTATPAARLHVPSGEVRLPGGLGGVLSTHFNFAGDGKNYIRGTTVLADSVGSVGIGTANPETRFHVEGMSLFHFDDWGNDTVIFRGQKSGAPNNWGEYAIRTNYLGLVFRNTQSDTEMLFVGREGAVGIGTHSPSSKLHVNGGDIRVSGGSFIDDGVTLNAPDYVFEPGYQLMPLADLKAYVAREKRLPNVPSAGEIKQQGLDLSRFQMRLLEKVEELTLYTLAQHEEIALLKEENAKLEVRLETLAPMANEAGTTLQHLVHQLEERLARLEGKQ